MLEQTQIRGRVWAENMESLDWMRTEAFYCNFIVAMDSASWIFFFSTERFTGIHGIDVEWIKKIFDRFLQSFIRFDFWWAGRSSEARCWIVNLSPFGIKFLATFETLAKQEIQQVGCDLPNQMGGFGGQRSKETVWFQYIIKFRQLRDVSEGIEKEWLLFRSKIISSAADSYERKRLRVVGDSEKRTLWWNQKVKETIRAKKDAFKALLQDRSSSDLQSRYTGARKAATSAAKNSKEKSWEEFGHRLDSNYFRQTKYFGRPSVVYVAKHQVSRTPSRILQVTF